MQVEKLVKQYSYFVGFAIPINITNNFIFTNI